MVHEIGHEPVLTEDFPLNGFRGRFIAPCVVEIDLPVQEPLHVVDQVLARLELLLVLLEERYERLQRGVLRIVGVLFEGLPVYAQLSVGLEAERGKRVVEVADQPVDRRDVDVQAARDFIRSVAIHKIAYIP